MRRSEHPRRTLTHGSIIMFTGSSLKNSRDSPEASPGCKPCHPYLGCSCSRCSQLPLRPGFGQERPCPSIQAVRLATRGTSIDQSLQVPITWITKFGKDFNRKSPRGLASERSIPHTAVSFRETFETSLDLNEHRIAHQPGKCIPPTAGNHTILPFHLPTNANKDTPLNGCHPRNKVG